MSFDIHLNIFSPEYVWAERFDEALAILERYGARASEQYHCFSVRWEDGSGLAIYSRSLFDSSRDFSALLTPLGGLSQRFCDFTYDFARRGLRDLPGRESAAYFGDTSRDDL